ncbi:MAG: hypothetical protein IJY22_02555 [Clostridia bacterium]|nr:hypothetical protein [Clostridia bacterium]
MAKPRKSYALWITLWVLRGLGVAVVFSVCALVIWRSFISNIPPSAMDELQPNRPLAEAFDTHGEALVTFYQEEGTMTRGEHNYGYFGVTRAVFVPEAGQLQVVVRYNNSTLTAIQNDKGLEQKPPKGEKILDVTLLKVVDLTPEDTSDNLDGSPNLGKVRLQPTGEPLIETTLLYTYCLYTFDGVTLDDGTIAAFADIYYLGDVDYNAEPYGTLRVYHVESTKIYASLDGDEIEALENYGK